MPWFSACRQFSDNSRGRGDTEPSSLTQLRKQRFEFKEDKAASEKADLQGSIRERKELPRERVPEICAGVPLSIWLNNSLCTYRVKPREKKKTSRKEQLPKSCKPNNSQNSHRAGIT